MNSLVTYLKNVRTELEHVVWPRPRTAIIHVVLIALICVITALIVTGLDYAFSGVIERYVETH
jgi:preprotein translocase SecE subunit